MLTRNLMALMILVGPRVMAGVPSRSLHLSRQESRRLLPQGVFKIVEFEEYPPGENFISRKNSSVGENVFIDGDVLLIISRNGYECCRYFIKIRKGLKIIDIHKIGQPKTSLAKGVFEISGNQIFIRMGLNDDSPRPKNIAFSEGEKTSYLVLEKTSD